MQPPEIAAAAARHKQRQLYAGAAMAILIVGMFAGIFAADAYGALAMVVVMALSTLPIVILGTRSVSGDGQHDVEILAAWSRSEAARLTDTLPDPLAEDPRWKQIAPLIRRLTDLLPDEGRDAVVHAEGRLRQLCADLRLLEESVAIEAGFEDSSPREARLEQALRQGQAEWEQTVGLLRDLHIELSTRAQHTGTLAALNDLVQQESASSEVEALDRARRAAASRAQKQ
ncbi:MAG: hypothetical protein ACI8S6_001189 [Myxococcota bacterium]|jgi:hypothetical protein